MVGHLDSKVAVITGAGAGLGQSYAMALAREGASIVVNDIATGQHASFAADETVQLIKDQGGNAVESYADITAISGGESLLETALDRFGRVDILVNNAGILRDSSLVKMEEKQWDAVMQVHLKGLYSATRPIFSWMKESGGGGVIVNCTSTVGLRGNFGQTNYAAAKSGVIGFSSSLALEGKKYGIRVWCLGPAAATSMTAHMPDDYKKVFHIDRVAPALVYMVSNLSGDQTGKTLLAGGGWVGEARFEVHSGYVPNENFDAQDLARAVAEGKVMFPERNPRFVTAYGPVNENRE
tara:strand:- start:12385 stop:13269 length:885 start_codon:yes stop_codon:yes gene_type:complete